MIARIKFNAGNIKSVQNTLQMGCESVITAEKKSYFIIF
jgi:hypothetical protein